MQEILIQKLHDYIRENNPDLLFELQPEHKVTDYLQGSVGSIQELLNHLLFQNRPASFIEELCMEELTRPLRPSRFNYLKNILQEEFPNDFERLQQNSLLTSELINLIAACDPVFDELNFSEEHEDDRNLHYAITGTVQEYFIKETSE